MRSTRLAGKVLLPLGDCRVIDWAIRRLAAIGPVVLCTSVERADDPLAQTVGCPVVRGSEDDVLGRFLQALGHHDGDPLVRATGDNPLVLHELATAALTQLQHEHADYCSIEGSALGTTVEVFTREALRRVATLATSAEEREHPTLGMLRRPELFRITRLIASSEYASDLRLTLDTPDDYTYLQTLIAAIGKAPEAVNWADIAAAGITRQSTTDQHLLAEVQRLKELAWQP